MSTKRNDEKKQKWAFIIAALLILVILGLIFIPGSVKTESIKKNESDTSYLVCNNDDEVNYALVSDQYTGVKYQLKLKFLDDELSSINLITSARYDDSVTAEKFANDIHAKYNIYIGEHDIDGRSMTPSYSHVDGTGKMSLYAEGSKIDYKNSALFFLESGIVDKRNVKDYERHFINKGFSCVLN